MIIYKNKKGFEQRSDKPNENWTDEDVHIVDDDSELANKVKNHYPYYSLILDGDGKLIDIEVLEKPVVEIPKADLEILQEENSKLWDTVQWLLEAGGYIPSEVVE